MITRKPRLRRQKKILKQQIKNFPRAKQMNINVATWGRLLKRSHAPQPIQNNNRTYSRSESPSSGTYFTYTHMQFHISSFVIFM